MDLSVGPLCQRDLRRLECFHNHCLRIIFQVNRSQQMEEHIKSDSLRELWGDSMVIGEKVMARRLEWLGHVQRMPSSRIPRKILFSGLPSKRPQHKPRKRWKDCVKSDMAAVGTSMEQWLETSRE